MADIRKEQLVLLKFEKQLIALAATLAAAGGVARAADIKLGGGEGADAIVSVQNALMTLATATGEAHQALSARAVEAGVAMLYASGGVPKKDPPQAIASILGLG